MLTVEIKVNGSCVKHIYAHNIDGHELSTYDVVVADTLPMYGRKPSMQEFQIKHHRSEGIGKLVSLILDKADGGDHE